MVNFMVGDKILINNPNDSDHGKIGTVEYKDIYGTRLKVKFSSGRCVWKPMSDVTLYPYIAPWLDPAPPDNVSNTKQFWMVKSVMAGATIVMHESKELAQAEAARLSNANPGIYFAVMEAVEMHYVPKTISPVVIKF